MTIEEIAKLLDGEIVGAPADESYDVKKAFASDLMSDVLRFHMDDTVLITGLCNNQTMRTSEMADLRVVVIGRDKQPDEDMLALAEDIDITIIKCKYSIFKISGILYGAGIAPLY
jgi:predicted transcriptional regulator